MLSLLMSWTWNEWQQICHGANEFSTKKTSRNYCWINFITNVTVNTKLFIPLITAKTLKRRFSRLYGRQNWKSKYSAVKCGSTSNRFLQWKGIINRFCSVQFACDNLGQTTEILERQLVDFASRQQTGTFNFASPTIIGETLDHCDATTNLFFKHGTLWLIPIFQTPKFTQGITCLNNRWNDGEIVDLRRYMKMYSNSVSRSVNYVVFCV